MPTRAHAPAVLALTLTAAVACAGPSPHLEGKALVVPGPGWSARVGVTDHGELRLTATADGAAPQLPPSTVELTPGAAGLLPSGGGWTAAGLRLEVDAAGALAVSRGGAPVARVRFEKGPGGGLVARLALPAAGAWHGLGQTSKALALPAAAFTLRHTPRFGDQTYLYIPFFFSSRGAAFYLNAASDDVITLDDGASATLSSATGRLDLYAWYAAEPAAAVSRFYRATGSQSLLPRWAFGYLQSRYGYRDEAELRRTVSTFARFGIPLSGVVLDLYWFKRMGDLDWDPVAFPDPAGLVEWVHDQGVKLITISEPFFTKESKHYAELDRRGLLARDAAGATATWGDWWAFGGQGGGVLDPEAPGATAFYGALYGRLARQGVDGFWTDLGEPESVPQKVRFGRYTEAQYHDFFNLAWSRLVRAGLLEAAPGKRPFILSRSGWTGIAGLGVSTWSGDVPSSWAGLQAQPALGLNASLSGLPFWGSDVGGFITEGGEPMPPDPELYLRWQQFGAFTPVYRAHGMGAREPWIYGPELMRKVVASIQRRVRLTPYVYSTAYQVWSQGLPMLRPLFFLEPGNAALHGDASAFLLGDALLVAPVLQPLAEARVKAVHLPPGGWVDGVTYQRLEGGRTLEVPVDLDTVPHWYREGAIVPLDLGKAGEGLLLVPGAAASRFTVFSDDGESEAYRSGAGEKLAVTLSAEGVSFSGAERARELWLQLPAWVPAPALERRGAALEGPLRTVKVALGKGTTRVDFR